MAATLDRLAPGARLARFELRRVLGQGAQAAVWLAFDPRLEREVALKLLHEGAQATVDDWLHEARNVGRLTHPHIVPVFEADVHEGRPYLVFEYVAGMTLAARLRRDGRLAPRIAVHIMLGVLEALQAAHAAGVVHRDLKPSNILLDASGRPRVMDFGIAARLHGAAVDRRIVGTPGYIAPEAARGEPPAPSMDVFAAGVVLVELLSGARLLLERDPYRAIARVAVEDLALPAFEPEVDEPLRALLRRAIARDPAQRWPDAAALHVALSQWLQPAPPATSGAAATNGTLDFLLRRMRHRSDFPALSAAVVRIQRVADSDEASLGSLASEILADVALTQKLLRLVNTAQYRHAGGGSISTVSRAVAVVGFAGIRNLALSLVLLEHLQDRAHAGQIRQEFLRSLLAGTLARELCAGAREGEEAFLGALFQGLGRLLAEYYLPEEALRVRALVQAGEGRATSEAQAAISVLGLSYEELGLGVARSWGLPEALQRCMRRPLGSPAHRLAERERPRWLAAAANDVAEALMQLDPAAQAPRIEQIAVRYGPALGLGDEALKAAVERSRERLADLARGMGLSLPPGAPGWGRRHGSADTLPASPHEDSLTPHRLQATLALAVADEPPTLPHKATDLLAAGIQDIADSMVTEAFRLDDVLRMILETMYRAIGFRRVVLCLRDAKSGMLTGRFGLGDGVAAACEVFKVPFAAKASQDLFGAVCLKGVDTLISDATAAGIRARLPDWFRRAIDAPAFLLLPLAVRGAPFGLIYADKALPGAIQLGEKELSMLRTLRNQAVMAFRQAGSR